MRSLRKALTDPSKLVPVPWASLGRVIRPRAGYLTIVFGAPGVGKSMFVLDWAASLGVPITYLSIDTDLRDQGTRLFSMVSGIPSQDIAHAELLAWLASDEAQAYARMRFVDHVVRADELHELVEAETLYWGQPPGMVIVDVVGQSVRGRDYQGFMDAFAALKRVAVDFDTLVVACHHVSRGSGAASGTKQLTMSDGIYGGDDIAQIVLGIWRPSHLKMRIGILKNRSGPMDPSGDLWVELDADLSRARITEPLYG